MRKLPVLQENFIPNGQIIIRANQTKPNQSKPIQAKRIETSGQKLSKYHVDGRRMKIKDNQPPMELSLDTSEVNPVTKFLHKVRVKISTCVPKVFFFIFSSHEKRGHLYSYVGAELGSGDIG